MGLSVGSGLYGGTGGGADQASIDSLNGRVTALENNAAGDTTTGTTANKTMPASATTQDYQIACQQAITYTPSHDSYVEVRVNGQGTALGDGTREADCYFSRDNGSSALAIADIAGGDHLYWVGSIAGYQLAYYTDVIDFLYERTP